MSAIYETKRRQAHKPLAICVADPSDVHRYGDTQVWAVAITVSDRLEGMELLGVGGEPIAFCAVGRAGGMAELLVVGASANRRPDWHTGSWGGQG